MKVEDVIDLCIYVTSEYDALCAVANHLQHKIGILASEILEKALYKGAYPEDGGQVYLVHKRTKTRKDVPIYITFAYWMLE